MIMSEMSSKLEQVLEYLVNGEQDKAESLLHDVIVEKARSIHEEIVNAQDTVEETAETKEEEAVEETKEESTEEAVEETKEESKDEAVEETVGGETGDAETDMKAELKQKAEEDSEEIDYEETNEDDGDEDGEKDDHDHEEVEDKVDDLAQALEELKAKFDDIVNGGEGDDEEAPAEDEAEAEAEESVEAPVEEVTQELEEAELKPVKVAHTDGSDKTKSPVASKNDMGGDAGNIAQGGDEKGASAPKVEDMGSTTEPNTSTVTADNKDGADASAKSPVASK
jgi:hypothetical protein